MEHEDPFQEDLQCQHLRAYVCELIRMYGLGQSHLILCFPVTRILLGLRILPQASR